ncbi:MAG: acetyl-CoA carboxylase biotin carboxylase subunit [Proteobacteria bacterium]|nr:acetyl-CoA carboxylase biotin carboxylase subunit [Pseudomonadota bacterium]
MTSVKKYNDLTHRPFSKVLIANRGEIAVRVIRACRDLGLSPIAVYSEADADSRHVSMADQAWFIGAGPSSDSYLRIDKIIDAAKKSGAEAVHPGFGFLSENADFANAVLEAGLVWVGPSPSAIHAMGDKTFAKRALTAAGVPCSPGKNEPLKDADDLKKVIEQLGYPVILKAAAGGGGRGMRVIRGHAEIEDSFNACQREAQSYFGNPDVFCERYIERPRHVEIQILADSKGNTIHLFERDCTIQRRNQKLIEEAPSSYISEETRAEMGRVAVKAAQSVGYVNAGTCEFILESPEKFYFMEMNTRIQVEHPVTEAITGIDLVQWQFRVAAGEALGFSQKDVQIRGWAFEARINAEDPFNGFRPSVGEISRLELPAGPGVRVDTHLYAGYRIPTHYDSMIAKIIVHGQNRDDALAKLYRALGETVIDGVETIIPYHQAVIRSAAFRGGEYTTRFVEENEKLLKDFEAGQQTFTAESALASLLKIQLMRKGQNQNSDSAGNHSTQGGSVTDSRSADNPWAQAHRLDATRR